MAVLAAEELPAHGHRDAADATLERAIRRLRSGALDAIDEYTLGRALYLAERWTEARTVFEALHRSDPRNVNYQGLLGVTFARLGDRARAADADRQLAGAEDPYIRGLHTRWRAHIAAVMGDRERAVQLLRQAAAEGIFIGIELHAQPDFESLRGYPPFQEFINPRWP